MTKKMKSSKRSTTSVFLYYPNLIGYFRVGLMIASFYFSMESWKVALCCYFLAFAGDVVDGYVARLFSQTSTFGGILDMVTDRVSTCGFLIVLSHLYAKYTFMIIMLIVLDITSHWFHVMSVSGHHKSSSVLSDRNIILRYYYAFYPLFGYCCVGTEFFYILLYVLHFYHHDIIYNVCYYICFPAFILKQIINLAQLQSAAVTIATLDALNATKS